MSNQDVTTLSVEDVLTTLDFEATGKGAAADTTPASGHAGQPEGGQAEGAEVGEEGGEEAMTRGIATVLLVCGIGVFVYGVTGYKGRGGIDGVRSAGWDDSSKAIMAAGAMLTAADGSTGIEKEASR